MKNLFLLSILLFSSCFDFFGDPPDSIKECYCCDELPEVTSLGVESFGFSYNDTIWICKGYGSIGFSLSLNPNVPFFNPGNDCKNAFIEAERSCYNYENAYQSILQEKFIISFISFPQDSQIIAVDNKQSTINFWHTKGHYMSTNRSKGFITITEFDTSSRIIAGLISAKLFRTDNLDSLMIKNGRFDIKF